MATTLVQWDDSLVLGIGLIDEHHRHLVDLLNKSFNTVMLNNPQAELEAVIAELSDYTTYHFAAEERLLGEHCYPGIETQRREHEDFCRRIIDFQERCGRGESFVTIDVVNMLSDWLVNHISKADRDFAPFLIARGVS